MRRLAWWLVFLVVGCARPLDLPEQNTLQADPEFQSVAPRQRLQLKAKGGSGNYRFAFAPNGQLSGGAATVSESGEYQAGERGLQQDLVLITDSSGNTTQARIAVTAPLAISPAISSVAPGGRLTFLATGGQPPYVFTLEDAGVTLDGGAYVAAAPGGRVDTILLSDATSDALATVRAQVSVGSGLLLYPPTVNLAPREALVFVGLGGQPPYRFALAPDAGSAGSLAPTIDALTGRYVAGSNDVGGTVSTDRVVMTDANGQTADALVTIGVPLSVSSLVSEVRPRQRVQLFAAGGKPPYTFAFQPRGNRSRGRVEATTGVYVPGTNSNARDLLQVSDVTGAVVTLPPFTVGPLQLVIPGGGGTQIKPVDLDGDRLDDLAVFLGSSGASQLTTVARPNATNQVATKSPIAYDTAYQLIPRNLNGDAFGDLLLTSRVGVDPFVGRFGGSVDGLPPVSLDGGSNASRVGIDGDWLYRWVFNRNPGFTGVQRVDLRTLSSATPTVEGLIPMTNPFAFTAGRTSTSAWVGWILVNTGLSSGLPESSGPFEFRYMNLATPSTVARSAQLPLPPGHRLIQLNRLERVMGSDLIIDDPALLGAERVLAVTNDADSGISWLWGIDPNGPGEAFAPFEIPTPRPAAGIAVTPAAGGRLTVAAWDGRSGGLAVMNVDRDAGATLSQQLSLPNPVYGATFADIDVDGLKDLVTTTPYSEGLDVVWGDGDGHFGRRNRFDVDSPATTAAIDLDGDGATDLVTADVGVIEVFWGVPGEHQFAEGPRTVIAQNVSQLTLGDFTGTGRLDLSFQDELGMMYLARAKATPGEFEVPEKVLNAQGRQDVGIGTAQQHANFGGAAPGDDLFFFMRDPLTLRLSATAWIRTGVTQARRVLVAPPEDGCEVTVIDLDGQGADDLLAACSAADDSGTLFYRSISSGAGETWTPGAWTLWAVPKPYGAVVQFVGPRVAANRLHLVLQDPFSLTFYLADLTLNGNTMAVSSTTLPLGIWSPTFASLTPSPDAGLPELVASPLPFGPPDDRLRVLAWNGTAWVVKQLLQVGRTTPLAVVRTGPGAPNDVLMSIVPLSAARSSDRQEVMVLVNDGTGTLR